MSATYSFREEGDHVIVREEWRTDDPDIPFVVAPWHPLKADIERSIEGAVALGGEYTMSRDAFVAQFGLAALPEHHRLTKG